MGTNNDSGLQPEELKARASFLATAIAARLLYAYEKAEQESEKKKSGKKGKKKGGGKGKKGNNKAGSTTSTFEPESRRKSSFEGEQDATSPLLKKQRANSSGGEDYDSPNANINDREHDSPFPAADTPEARKQLYQACLSYCFGAVNSITTASSRAGATLVNSGSSSLFGEVFEFEKLLHAHKLTRISDDLGPVDAFLDQISILHAEEKLDLSGDSKKTNEDHLQSQSALAPPRKETRWSQFKMWATLAPSIEECTFFVPRFFLVDLGAAMEKAPYDVDKEVTLLVDETKKHIFVGQSGMFNDKTYNDGQRQGYHFESKLLDGFSDGGRTHLLTVLEFCSSGSKDHAAGGGRSRRPSNTSTAMSSLKCVYSCAPDFAFGEQKPRPEKEVDLFKWKTITRKKEQNLNPASLTSSTSSAAGVSGGVDGNKVSTKELISEWLATGKSCQYGLPGDEEKVETLHIWKQTTSDEDHSASAPSTAVKDEPEPNHDKSRTRSTIYGELKRTRHLFGKGGELKKLKYWLQAYFGNINRVIVGLDGDHGQNRSDDKNIINEVLCFETNTLVPDLNHQKKCMLKLQNALEWIQHTVTGKSQRPAGQASLWTLKIRKEDSFATTCKLQLVEQADEKVPSFVGEVFSTT
ncbi:unnamed protein product [Amoebophrya sp. A120]|nr:unnamed protein product [Amoebophrya sp. A120]|eukprot:GSA120T00017259001.1